MKPIVIYPKNDGEKVTLTKKDFEEYLRQAYDSGYSDGYANGRSTNWWTTPITYPTITTSNKTSKPLDITWNTNINTTCDAHNDL